MCKIGFRNVGFYRLGIILSPSISEAISTEGVIELKNSFLNLISHTLMVSNGYPVNPDLRGQTLPLEISHNTFACFRSLRSVISLKGLLPLLPTASRRNTMLMDFSWKICPQVWMTGSCSAFPRTSIGVHELSQGFSPGWSSRRKPSYQGICHKGQADSRWWHPRAGIALLECYGVRITATTLGLSWIEQHLVTQTQNGWTLKSCVNDRWNGAWHLKRQA